MTFRPSWSNADAARFGYLVGLGRTAPSIASEIAGITVEGVYSLRRHWKLNDGDRRGAIPVTFEVSAHQRRLASKRAAEIGVSVEEYLRRVCACVIEDDLYDAVTDGRFE